MKEGVKRTAIMGEVMMRTQPRDVMMMMMMTR